MFDKLLSKNNRSNFLAVVSMMYLLMMFVIWQIDIKDILLHNSNIFQYANHVLIFTLLINFDRVMEEKRIKSILVLIFVMGLLRINSFYVDFGYRSRDYIFSIIPIFMVYLLVYQLAFRKVIKYGFFCLLVLLTLYNVVGIIGAIFKFDYFLFNIPNTLIDNYRYSSVLTNPNAWGEFAFISLWISTLFMIKADVLWQRIAYTVVIAISVLALVASMSRTSLLMTAVLYVFLLVFSGKLNLMVRRLLRLSLVLIVIGVISLVLIDFEFVVSLFRLNQGLTDRDQIWVYLVDQIKENLFFGVGYGNSTMLLTSSNHFKVSSPHNLYLAMLYEMGIITFVVIMIYLIRRIVTNFKFLSLTHKYDMDLMWISGFMIAFLIGQFFEYSFFTIGAMNTFVFVLLAISLGIIKEVKKEGIYKIKVTHMITGLDNGGAESMLYKVLKHGDQSKFDFKVISLSHEGFYGKKIESLGIKVITLNLEDKKKLPKAVYLLIKHTSKTDVLQTWLYHANFIGTLVGRLLCVEKVIWGVRQADISVQHNKPSTVKFAQWSKYIAFMSSVILSNSDEVMNAHVALGYPKNKFVTIYNGFDLSLFKHEPGSKEVMRNQLGIDQDKLVFIQVARYDIQKDHETAFIALALFKANVGVPFEMIYCGMGMESSNINLINQLKTYNLLDDAHLLGVRSDIPQLLSAADYFILSSLGEGFPNVLGEAMSNHLIPIVTDAGDCKMIVGDAGFVCDRQNAEALYEGLKKAYQLSAKEQIEIREKARKRIENNFDITHITKQYEMLYHL